MPLLQGTSALHVACWQLYRHGCDGDTLPDIVKMLVAHGADVNAHQSHVSMQVCNECTWSLTLCSRNVRELQMAQDAMAMLVISHIV